MAYVFVVMLVLFALAILAMRTATDFLAWAIMKIKTKMDEMKKGDVTEETEPL